MTMKWMLHKSTLSGLQQRLESGNRLLLFLNYDSILLPRGAAPLGGLEPEMREKLRELSELNSLTLVVVSDRSLTSLRKIIGISGIYFIANNGLEIHGPDLNVIHAEAKRARNELAPVVQTLTAQLADLPATVLDDRGFSISLNFMEAKPPIQRRARLVMEQAWTPIMDGYVLQERNHELILRPRLGWNKGRAVMFLWNKFASPRRRPVVVYVGADESEEEIYNLMGREGVGVVMGGESRLAQTKAAYFLKNRPEVSKFILWLLQNLNRTAPSGTPA